MTTKTLIKDILVATSGVTAFTLLTLAPVLAYAADAAPQSQTVIVKTVEANAELHGSFEGRSKHVTSGDVSIVKTAAGYELVLADNFFLDGAPDPVIGFGNNGKYDRATTFTQLEKKEGRQTYTLPEGFVLGAHNQVFVWCDDFSVPLGVANLTKK